MLTVLTLGIGDLVSDLSVSKKWATHEKNPQVPVRHQFDHDGTFNKTMTQQESGTISRYLYRLALSASLYYL